MSSLRELKTRIGSVSSSEKITGAMKMISSAKVRKFEASLRKLVPFRNQIKSIMGHLLATDQQFSSQLIENRDVNNIALVVFGSDDGLCGAYNTNIFKFLLLTIDNLRLEYGDNVEITLYPIGKKIKNAIRKICNNNIKVVDLRF